jgi:hypothetical protein
VQAKIVTTGFWNEPIFTFTHASKVFRTLDIILKDTPIVERLGFELVPLDDLDTTSGQHVDDLVA